MRVFVAGATGVIGRPLLRALLEDGHEVVAMTRSPDKARAIADSGATVAICDALDRDAVRDAVVSSSPEVVVHQLTSMPSRYRQLNDALPATNRLRTEGTRNLVDACFACGARRLIAQSIAFLYAPEGPAIKDEGARPWTDAPAPFDRAVQALLELDATVTGTPGIEGLVLRYGALYGPGTWYAADGDVAGEVRRRRFPLVGSGGGIVSWLHVEDAAAATVRAIESGPPGIYNVTDDQPVSYREWLPAYAQLLSAKRPTRIPRWVARLVAGSLAVAILTEQRGASNRKAKQELGWQPRYPSWLDGFARSLDADAA